MDPNVYDLWELKGILLKYDTVINPNYTIARVIFINEITHVRTYLCVHIVYVSVSTYFYM